MQRLNLPSRIDAIKNALSSPVMTARSVVERLIVLTGRHGPIIRAALEYQGQQRISANN